MLAIESFEEREWPGLLVVVRDATLSLSRAGGPVERMYSESALPAYFVLPGEVAVKSDVAQCVRPPRGLCCILLAVRCRSQIFALS